MFLKPQGDPDLRYLVLFDEIETAGKRPRQIEWRLLSPYGKATVAGGTSRIEGRAAWVHIRHLWPEASTVRIDSTPAPAGCGPAALSAVSDAGTRGKGALPSPASTAAFR